MNKLIIVLILMAAVFPVISASELSDIEDFLATDQTDSHKYTDLYTCGFFARDLSHNASLLNISIGSVMITRNEYPLIIGHNNHIINYFTIDSVIYFIEPRTDEIMTAKRLWKIEYLHGRLYPDGTQVPTNFRGSMSATYDLSEHLDETLPEPVWMQHLQGRISYFSLAV